MNLKNNLSLALLLLLSLVLIQSCKKEEFEHPEIKSSSITALSAARIRMTGEIVHKGKFKIQDHGFLYSIYSTVTMDNGTAVSMGAEVSEGSFSKEFPVNLTYIYNRRIYARSYLINEKGTAYGDIISVEMPSIQTSGLTPSSGKAGDKITVQGSFSQLLKEDVTILVGNINAEIQSISPSEIVFIIPPGVNTSGSYDNRVEVSLRVGGVVTGNLFYLTLLPTFTDFSPKRGPINAAITLSGNNFPYYSSWGNGLKIYFGSVYTTSFNTISSNSIRVNVPPTVTSTSFPIAVEVNGIKTTLPGEFTLDGPSVSTVSPTSGWPGTYLTISGSNFVNYSYYDSGYRNVTSVKIGGVEASVSNITSSQISAAIPNSLTEGEYKVVVNCGPFVVEAPDKVRVKAMAFTGFSPTSGGPGREITLTGEFNPSLYYNVYFGNTAYSSPSSVTSTSMKVNVPGYLDAGDVKISIRSGSNINLSNNTAFTVLAPTITSISPTSGVAGTIVTISGSGFSSYNVVKFGTTPTSTILSATESTLRVLVPSNLNPGAMKITVTNGFNQTVVSQINFTVTN